MGLFKHRPIIADRAEFVEALQRLRQGHVLVKVGEGSCSCTLDGGFVHHSFDTLKDYGLIDEFNNPRGFVGVRYFRISEAGCEFADRTWSVWRGARPIERAVMRLVG